MDNSEKLFHATCECVEQCMAFGETMHVIINPAGEYQVVSEYQRVNKFPTAQIIHTEGWSEDVSNH